MATIGAHYFQVCTRGAERAGVDRDMLLHAAGIDPDAADRPDWRGSVEAMSLLVRTIQATLDDEHMGCTRRRVKSGAFAMMTELAIQADTVLAALAKGIAFYDLLDTGMATRLDISDDHVVLHVAAHDPAADPDHYFTEFWMIIWHRFACWLAGETIALELAEFDYARPDEYYEEFKYLFPTRHRFRASGCRLHFDRAPLMGAIIRTASDRREMVATAPLDFMTIPASDHSMARRVRRLLTPTAGAGFEPATREQIAERLNISPVLLARRLRAEGTSLSAIVENIRRDMAIARLIRRGATIDRIAADLGYAETRSFTRAFRQWMGESPLRYRTRLAAG
ncbi:AraC-type DNA-binding protein [Sphingomonas sp. YR710]|uniref:AraC family transcriptional regulator n=1 Tax=Sphingomonas sp. YR710 TaxID=1882773 RepID=UPI0008814DAB|nr:AraC family transcriptional regulator [Sphingomonas sp. YR710]SDD29267.1 AraC-type DNA-binding protein [Sphingomonas sp. YR710]